jgi:hypothetical protein
MTELERIAYHEASHCVAALTFSIPIISVTIENDTPHLLRGRYRPPDGIGLECLVTMCLAGPVGEKLFCGSPDDASGQIDYDMARHYLSDRYDLLQVEAEIVRFRDAAFKLLQTPWAEQRVRLITAALLDRGTLTGEDIAASAFSAMRKFIAEWSSPVRSRLTHRVLGPPTTWAGGARPFRLR